MASVGGMGLRGLLESMGDDSSSSDGGGLGSSSSSSASGLTNDQGRSPLGQAATVGPSTAGGPDGVATILPIMGSTPPGGSSSCGLLYHRGGASLASLPTSAQR